MPYVNFKEAGDVLTESIAKRMVFSSQEITEEIAFQYAGFILMMSENGVVFQSPYSAWQSFDYQFSVSDDSVKTVESPFGKGYAQLYSYNNIDNDALIVFRAEAAAAVRGIDLGANVETATGVLTGTTGTDGKITISPHTDGKIYIENRTGSPMVLYVAIGKKLTI